MTTILCRAKISSNLYAQAVLCLSAALETGVFRGTLGDQMAAIDRLLEENNMFDSLIVKISVVWIKALPIDQQRDLMEQLADHGFLHPWMDEFSDRLVFLRSCLHSAQLFFSERLVLSEGL